MSNKSQALTSLGGNQRFGEDQAAYQGALCLCKTSVLVTGLMEEEQLERVALRALTGQRHYVYVLRSSLGI